MKRSPDNGPRRFCLAENDLPGAITGAVSGLLGNTVGSPECLLDLLVDYTSADAGALFGGGDPRCLHYRGIRPPVPTGPGFTGTALLAVSVNTTMVHGGQDGPGKPLLLFPWSRSALLVPLKSLSGDLLILLNSRHESWFSKPVIRFVESMKTIYESFEKRQEAAKQ
jgi:hypothetical protein